MMRRFSSRGHLAAGFPVLLLAMAAWVVQLGGLAALQQSCTSGPNVGVTRLALLPQLAPGSCSKFYRFDWWVVAWEAFVLFLVFLSLATMRVYHSRTALVAFLAVAAVLEMYEANLFLNYKDNVGRAFGNTVYNRAVVYFWGALFSALFDLLLILVLGSGVHTSPVVDKGYGGPGTGAGPYNAPAGTTAAPGYAPGATAV